MSEEKIKRPELEWRYLDDYNQEVEGYIPVLRQEEVDKLENYASYLESKLSRKENIIEEQGYEIDRLRADQTADQAELTRLREDNEKMRGIIGNFLYIEDNKLLEKHPFRAMAKIEAREFLSSLKGETHENTP